MLSNILIHQHGRNILDYEGPHDVAVHLLFQSCYQLYTIPYSICSVLLTLPLSSSTARVMPACLCPILFPAPYVSWQLRAMVSHEVKKLKGKKVVLGPVGIPVLCCSLHPSNPTFREKNNRGEPKSAKILIISYCQTPLVRRHYFDIDIVSFLPFTAF